MKALFTTQTKAESQTLKRIKILMYACSYELWNTPLISDAEFDKLALEIDVNISTKRPDLDKWFRENFDPSTGQWVHNFPELKRIKELVRNHFSYVF